MSPKDGKTTKNNRRSGDKNIKRVAKKIKPKLDKLLHKGDKHESFNKKVSLCKYRAIGKIVEQYLGGTTYGDSAIKELALELGSEKYVSQLTTGHMLYQYWDRFIDKAEDMNLPIRSVIKINPLLKLAKGLNKDKGQKKDQKKDQKKEETL